MRYAYPCNLEPEGEEGFEDWFTVTFPDVPGALTCGYGLGEALENAEEVLELVLGDYIENAKELPIPSPLADGQELVVVHPPFAAKLALHVAMQQQGIARTELAERLGMDEAAVQEMLDPYVITPLSQLTRALQVTGRRLVVEDLAADGGEHIFYPATRSGNLGMSRREFIRRIRRYALAHALTWRIEWPDIDEEEEPSLLRAGNQVVTLPEADAFGPDVVELMLKGLNMDRREF